MPSPIVPLDAWLAQNLRLTLFLQRPLERVDAIWTAAVGDQQIELDENRPRDGFRRLAMTVGEGLLEMQITAARADLLMGPLPVEPTALSQGVTPRSEFGSVAEQLPRFSEVATKFLAAASPQTFRIAVGGGFLIPAAGDRNETYSYFSKLVPSLRVDPANQREVFYRVNRPVRSAVVTGLELNRITTWHALRLRMSVSSAPEAVAGTLIERHFFRLEIDNSTPAERSIPLESAALGAIFEELATLATENAEYGECP